VDASQIFECHIHTCRTVRNMLLGVPMVNRASSLTSESMDCCYSEEFSTNQRKHYGLGDHDLEFFTVHMQADKEHTEPSAQLIAGYIKTPRDERLVRESAHFMVRIKLGKFDGLYEAYS
jgi:pyrroloquinoline quinone (PQQ) biosynthesis protein C